MNETMREMAIEIKRLEQMLQKIDAFLQQAPEGCLKWQNKGEKTYYYQQYKDDLVDEKKNSTNQTTKKNKWKRKYITKENMELAKMLAKKHYYIALKPVIQNRIKAMKLFAKYCPDKEMDAIYEGLCVERKNLIEPIEPTLKDKVKEWNEELYEKNTSFPENLRYETEQGDIVRSKSEVIIANLLYQNRRDIIYKYEKPLEIVENGRMKTIYPDFSIMNVHTGKIIYWEHAGLMDDAFYANEFVRKMNMYSLNGLIPGKDVVVTYETSLTPLDIKVVNKLIKELLRKERVL